MIELNINNKTIKYDDSGKKNILIVDDEFFVRDILIQFLDNFGYNPIDCSHTTEAKNIFETLHKKNMSLDLILMDIKMPADKPKPNGLDLGKELYDKFQYKNIIYISAYSAEKETEQEIKNRKSTCIAKPFKMNSLKEKIDKYFINDK